MSIASKARIKKQGKQTRRAGTHSRAVAADPRGARRGALDPIQARSQMRQAEEERRELVKMAMVC